MDVRAAEVSDLEPVLLIADRRRREYAEYQPRLWNPDPDAVAKQRTYFAELLDDPETLFAVATTPEGVQGFVIARLVPAPPVYNPGGPTCLVDDFTVDNPASWSDAGPLLLAAVRSWAGRRGAVQLVVVTAGADDAKRAVLDRADLSLASEWWVGSVR